jgi:hypothetical protein
LDEQHLYEDCWNGKWKCNLVELEQWVDISAIFPLFPFGKIQQTRVKFILYVYVGRTKVNLDVANALNNL